MPKSMLILTLYCGENEFAAQQASLDTQTHTQWEQRVFENLPNKQAHDALYRTIMQECERYDLFIKLDADMVLAHDDVLSALEVIFEQDEQLDHLVVGVEDGMTDTTIKGLHVFSHRVRWQSNEEALFVDPSPAILGHKQMIDKPDPPMVHHSVDPSPMQAFHFGIHRALKATQSQQAYAQKRPDLARQQWRYIGLLWQHFCRTQERRLGLALMGAEYVLQGRAPEDGSYDNPTLKALYEEAEALPTEAMMMQLKAAGWAARGAGRLRWLRAMGVAMWLKILLAEAKCQLRRVAS